jgi:hypothetical protein
MRTVSLGAPYRRYLVVAVKFLLSSAPSDCVPSPQRLEEYDSFEQLEPSIEIAKSYVKDMKSLFSAIHSVENVAGSGPDRARACVCV